MVRSVFLLASVSLLAASCGGAPPAPPALAYGAGPGADLTYDFADTTEVDVSVMGQSMQLSQRGVATYDVSLVNTTVGVDVVLNVRTLDATLSQPMGAPVRVDQSAVRGALEFSLDRIGGVTLTSTPSVADEASQMVSGLSLAHGFFPRLPGRAALPGDTWVDTVSWSGAEGPGARSERSVLNYTVRGDTVVDGRALLMISVAGETTVTNELAIAGMSVGQRSELEVEGHVLWDLQSNTLYEQVRHASGPGQVSVPIAPAPLPIRVRSTQRARVQSEGSRP
jgi:hypothetical protein